MMKAAGEKPWAYEKEERAKESTQSKEGPEKESKESQEKFSGESTEAEI
jgi:hypothetical protein